MGGKVGGREGGRERERGGGQRESESEREQERERERDTHVSPGGADNNAKWRAHTRIPLGTHTNTHTYIDVSP